MEAPLNSLLHDGIHKRGLGDRVGLSRPFITVHVEYLPWETTSRRRPLFLAQRVVAYRRFNFIKPSPPVRKNRGPGGGGGGDCTQAKIVSCQSNFKVQLQELKLRNARKKKTGNESGSFLSSFPPKWDSWAMENEAFYGDGLGSCWSITSSCNLSPRYPPGRGYSSRLWVGVCRPGLQMWTSF